MLFRSKIFEEYKKFGSKWSRIARGFPERSPNDIKNKFYTILKKIATRAQLENPEKYDSKFLKCKYHLLQFVDIAIEHGYSLPSRRGRKPRDEIKLAKKNAVLFPPEIPKKKSLHSINQFANESQSIFPNIETKNFGMQQYPISSVIPQLYMCHPNPAAPLILNYPIGLYVENPNSLMIAAPFAFNNMTNNSQYATVSPPNQMIYQYN